MPILTQYTDKQVQILTDFRVLETKLYISRPTSLSLARGADYFSKGESLAVREGAIFEFLFLLIKEYTGEPEDFEAFLKEHLNLIYRKVCAVSAKERITKLLEEARELANDYELTTFYQDNC